MNSAAPWRPEAAASSAQASTRFIVRVASGTGWAPTRRSATTGIHTTSRQSSGICCYRSSPALARTDARIFDEPSDRRIDEPAEPVPAAAILVFDGLFLLRPELRNYWSLSVFLTAETRREAVWNEYLMNDLPEHADLRAKEMAARTERGRRSRYVEGQALYERAKQDRLNTPTS